LQKGAIETLLDCGAIKENILSWDVPGSFELVYGCRKMIQSQKIDAIIAIGNVIQGETKHFDFVCEGVTQGIVDLNVKYEIPVIFCVLTDNTKQQSIDRSGGKLGNKGIECAVAAIKMAALKNIDTITENIGF
jgi:6,7-dimethyl-8-ribityllumazine synthase